MEFLTKQEWLKELVTVDEWGRPADLSNVPMILMQREKVFKLRAYNQDTIEGMWKIYLTYNGEIEQEKEKSEE